MEKSPVQSVRKALDLLDLVVWADLGGKASALADLAEKMRMRPNSVWNLLKTLCDCGYLTQQGRGLYTSGSKIRQLGSMNRFDAPAVREGIEACLGHFAQVEMESAVMAILVGGARLVLTRAEADRAVTISHDRVEESGFFAKPTGRMLAAMADPERLDRILAHNGPPGRDWDGMTDRPQLERALEPLARNGLCAVPDQKREIFAAACPVRSSPADTPAVVGVYAPLYRCDRKRQAELISRLRETADEVGQSIAGTLPV
jgi:DNA-binding IclR family transcriptional regulator